MNFSLVAKILALSVPAQAHETGGIYPSIHSYTPMNPLRINMPLSSFQPQQADHIHAYGNGVTHLHDEGHREAGFPGIGMGGFGGIGGGFGGIGGGFGGIGAIGGMSSFLPNLSGAGGLFGGLSMFGHFDNPKRDASIETIPNYGGPTDKAAPATAHPLGHGIHQAPNPYFGGFGGFGGLGFGGLGFGGYPQKVPEKVVYTPNMPAFR